jgi:hypothetical protein
MANAEEVYRAQILSPLTEVKVSYEVNSHPFPPHYSYSLCSYGLINYKQTDTNVPYQ